MSMDPVNFILSIFSGIGKKLFEKKSEPSHLTIQNTIQIPEAIKEEKLDSNSEVSGIVKRLNEFKELLNESKKEDKYTIVKLAKIMGLKSVGELERIFTGKDEPDFEFIKNFCDLFNLNEEWLTEGKQNPFYLYKPIHDNQIYYYRYIKECRARNVYLIRAVNGEAYGCTFIILELSDFKYEIIRRLCNINIDDKACGWRDLYEMYKLIRKLNNDTDIHITGKSLNESIFHLLYSGKIFPGTILKYRSDNDPWWYDFMDVYNEDFSLKYYQNKYGSGFVTAQKVVKTYLETEK